jgi:hypothetical protein
LNGATLLNTIEPPQAMHGAARRFTLTVAGLVFVLMLAFGGWVIASGTVRGGDVGANPIRILAGAVIGAAALTLLASVRAAWRSEAPFQHSRTAQVGFALLGLGATILVAG